MAGVVGPRQARFLDLVDGLVDQGHVTGQACRGNDFLLGIEQDVGAFIGGNVAHQLREADVLLELDDGVGTIGLRSGLGDHLGIVAAAIAGLVVPHHFHTILRNREGVVVRLLEVLQAVAVVDRLGGQRTFLRRVIGQLRRRATATGWVYRNLVAVRIALEHRLLAGGQLVLVLRDIVLGDGEQRLVALVGVAEEAVGVHRRGTRLETAGPLRNAAVGIAGLLATQRGQGGAQFGGFLRRNRRHHAGGQQRERQYGGLQLCNCFHVLALSLDQKFTPTLSETKSRSPLVLKLPPKKSV
ncbi:hypothetical protein D3C78_732360 [compost metagenome]